MIDQIYDRGYQSGRADLNGGIDALVRKLRDAVTPALAALHRVQWDAPWNVQSGPRANA